MSNTISPSPQRHSSCEFVDETISKQKTREMNCCEESTSDSRFSCNICFDEVTEPVVTRCGHLYCWPCLFQWLEPGMNQDERESLGLSSFRMQGRDKSRQVCPVCKSGCPLSAVVPLYIRSEHKPIVTDIPSNNDFEAENDANSDTGLRRRRASHEDSTQQVPNRPSQQYPEPSSPPASRRSSPGSSPRSTTDNPYRTVQLTPRSPNGHNGSLTYGIISSLQRATAEFRRPSTEEPRQIPSLHDRRNPLNNTRFDSPQRYSYDDGNGALNSETTQYLTRLLIMLTSFVIFCFLLV